MRAGKLLTYFLPFVVNSLLRLAAIPVTTYILGPPEYGLFALMMGVVNICTVLATSVTGYIINHRAHPGEVAPRGLIVTVALVEVIAGLILICLCMAGWPWFARWMGVAGDVSSLSFLWLLLSVPLGAFWTSGSMVMVFDQRAGLYSTTLIAQGAIQLLTTVVALYVFDWRVGSLVAGQVMGVLVCAIGGYLGLKRHFSFTLDRGIVQESLALMPWSMASGFANSSTDLLERVVLGRVTNTFQLGLYVHSQSYRTMLAQAGKAFYQVLQPAMLIEARSTSLDFSGSRKGWNVVFAMISLMGVGFALLGEEVISWLTHGKFKESAIFVPFWCIFLLFQYTGRPQVAMLYAHGQGKKISSALLIGRLVSAFLMVVLGVPFHAFGLVAAVIAGELVNRVALHYWSHRQWALGFHDGYALAGAAAIALVAAVTNLIAIPLAVRMAVFGALTVMILIISGPTAYRFLSRRD